MVTGRKPHLDGFLLANPLACCESCAMHCRHSRTIALLFACCFGSLFAADSSNWAQFRGAGALGVADNPNLPERWSTNENVAWKIEVPGRGWSSPIVWGERIFVTSVASESEMELPKK